MKVVDPQTQLFGPRGPAPIHDNHHISSWLFRRHLIHDFKIRVACPAMFFTPRTSKVATDSEGRPLVWVKDHTGAFTQQVKTTHNESTYRYVQIFDPPYATFPSQETHTDSTSDYIVTGDDHTTWISGSRGNSLDIILQEIANHTQLWPREKAFLCDWIHNSAGLDVGFDDRVDNVVEQKLIQSDICAVDSYIARQIITAQPITESEIEASRLPAHYIENLIYNLRQYVGKTE